MQAQPPPRSRSQEEVTKLFSSDQPRFSPTGLAGQSFDTVLPQEVRKQFAQEGANRKPVRQPSWPIPAAIIVGAVLIALAIQNLPQRQINRLSEASRVTPTPTPVSSPPPALLPPLRRAALVKLPAPRAELVTARAPQMNFDPVLMPYGTHVLVHWLGRLDSFASLPTRGNHIGDEYTVGDMTTGTPYVWITAPGTTAPAWIDP
jgi:hypothetical protein